MRKRLSFDNLAVVEALGFSGGIWCFSESVISFEVLEKHDQVLHGVFNEGKREEWGISVVYGSPNFPRRRDLWKALAWVESFGSQKWCYCGDFNATLNSDERESMARKKVDPDRLFKQWVTDFSLCELEAAGPRHTWGRAGVSSKLDRVLLSSQWLSHLLIL